MSRPAELSCTDPNHRRPLVSSNRTVYKWRIPINDGPVPFALPVGAKIVHAEMALRGTHPLTGGTIEFWALVDRDAEAEQRAFIVRGTGHPVPDEAQHVATMRDGMFVWHLFEVPAIGGDGR